MANMLYIAKILPCDAKIFLAQLSKQGYKYIARDPDDNMLCAYKHLPTLDNGCYTLTDAQMNEPYSCFVITPTNIRMFIHDYDVHSLSGTNLQRCCQIPINATDGPVCINKLLAIFQGH